jgi:hypothetical protein
MSLISVTNFLSQKVVFDAESAQSFSFLKEQVWVMKALCIAAFAADVLLVKTGSVSNFSAFLHLSCCVVWGISFSLLMIVLLDKQADFDGFSKTRTGEGVTGKDVILIISSSCDETRASSFFNPLSLSKLKNQNKYTIICKKVDSFYELHEVVREVANRQNNRIRSLWIRAHGSPLSLSLSSRSHQDSVFWVDDCSDEAGLTARQWKKSLSLLSKDASIVLESCSTGEIAPKGRSNVARVLAAMAGGRKVFAPTQNIHTVLGKVESFDPFHYRFRDVLDPKTGFLVNFFSKKNLIEIALLVDLLKFKRNPLLEDVTACYRDTRDSNTQLVVYRKQYIFYAAPML